MNYSLLKDVIDLVSQFEAENEVSDFANDVNGFKEWIISSKNQHLLPHNFTYEGKENGRSLESVISTFLIHLGRYAKMYSKSAIHDSIFSTQDEFIFLITLKTFGAMSKMELIKRNIHDKPSGMQIISRLLNNELIVQENDPVDKRSKIISITAKGLECLEEQMFRIRQATKIVAGNLTEQEKIHLVYLLNKLEDFHLPIYAKNMETKDLLQTVHAEYFDN